MFEEFLPLAAIATTPLGAKRLQVLTELLQTTLWVPASVTSESSCIQVYQKPLQDHLAQLWDQQKSLVFCLTTGAVVRLIAPLLQNKETDPAVVVVDEAGKFVISLCGGHQGGADRLTQLIALQIGATPVLTGASNRLGLPGIDVLGVPYGWTKGEGDWTGVSAAIARQDPVQVIQETGSTLWRSHLPKHHSFQFGFPEFTATVQEEVLEPTARVWISAIQRRFAPDSGKVQWHPRVLWVGIGCERGTSKALIGQAIREVFAAHHLAEGAIAGIATIDLKADEVGLLDFCRDWLRQAPKDCALPLKCFSAEDLRKVNVPTPSDVVEAEVGTPSVAEAAALLAANLLAADFVTDRAGAKLLDTNPSSDPHPPLLIPKQIVRQAGQPGAVTIAVAQSPQEYTGRTGKLWLVGIGPGELAQITPAAQSAIAHADVVIGYSLYVDLVAPILRPGQIVEALPITQERQRAERAIQLANWGLTVAVISSGDCGIYGMAGLVLEELRAQEWTGTPDVQVFPGITALQATAARVGAPLMHDFCAISLSDLLTPWEVIEKRLTAAAQADFVTALYNPKSQTRTGQIAIAQQIFLQHRDRATPVALVRSAYRPDEEIRFTTLEKLLDEPIDMLTTVLIGNQSTQMYCDRMITPRGYLGFGR
ncbi:MAG: precorrin-3B C(17)-methyltransferase [Myxacorys chilensis ATA2-1-KO14]|nr:precorrin-3B C(17)-methyltransferase [Myxacorys chilensis ATA2-1-KO14]